MVGALTAIVLLILVASARAADGVQTTLLLSPSGQPVGGPWQQWMNDSHAPTYLGSMTVGIEPQVLCNGIYVDACTRSDYQITPDVIPPDVSLPETAISENVQQSDPAAYARWVLLYEQGHVVDGQYLNDADRSELLQLWGVTPPTNESLDQFWYDGESTFNASDQNPVMVEWFSESYVLCAVYGNITWLLLDSMHGSEWPSEGLMGFDSYPVYEDWRTPYIARIRRRHRIVALRVEYRPPTLIQERWQRAQQELCQLIRGWVG
jgi:hypothetical protein